MPSNMEAERYRVKVSRSAGDAPILVVPAVQEMLDRLAPTDATLLIIGETGTGKEVAARYIHAQSRRRSGPFLAVNCGALSDMLAEAELFGHEKGAFTGAIRSQRGWFEAAAGGTLLLDEIGDLPLHLQVKLLRVLQEREITKVGSRVPIPVDVRIIAATNIDLHSAIAEKRFREDLYFRLNLATIILPPLRERKDNLHALAQHFLRLHGEGAGRRNMAISAGAMMRLARHSWPGNIRELENVIHNAVLLTRSDIIESDHLSLPPASPQEISGTADSFEMALRALFGQALRDKESRLFERVTRTLVQSAFDLADKNQIKAAELLGVSRNTLRTQLSYLGIIPHRQRADQAGRSGEAAPKRHGRGKEIRLGYQKFGMLSILRARGVLESRLHGRGISVQWLEYPAGPQLLDALGKGVVDFGSTGEVPPIFAQANDAPILYVAYEPAAPRSEAVVVPFDSTIRCVADLRGKRVKFNKGSNVHYLLLRGLEANKMSLNDIEPVYAAPQEPRSMIGDDADGFALWDPLLTIVQRSKEVRVLFDGNGLVLNHQFHIARKNFTLEHPEIIRDLVEEIRSTGRWLAQNPIEAARSLSSRIGMDIPTLDITFNRMAHGTRFLDHEIVWEQQKIADRFYALGLIPRAISVSDAVWPAR